MFSQLLKGMLQALRCSRSGLFLSMFICPRPTWTITGGHADHKAGLLKSLSPALFLAIFTWPPW